VFVKFDMDHIVLFHLGDGMGGDQFGVEALGHVGQVLEHIHWMSTTMASQAPVMMASSCCR
jgi:hypothetical protein